MTTQTQEPSKPKSAYVDEAVGLAVDARWDEAVELNEFIIRSFGADEGTQNRLGKALTELGRLEDAKSAYDAALAINPMNPVARKNTAKLESLINAKDILKGGPVKVDLRGGARISGAASGGSGCLQRRDSGGHHVDCAVFAAGDAATRAARP